MNLNEDIYVVCADTMRSFLKQKGSTPNRPYYRMLPTEKKEFETIIECLFEADTPVGAHESIQIKLMNMGFRASGNQRSWKSKTTPLVLPWKTLPVDMKNMYEVMQGIIFGMQQ